MGTLGTRGNNGIDAELPRSFSTGLPPMIARCWNRVACPYLDGS